MSRISNIDKLYENKINAEGFNFNRLIAPPMASIFSAQDPFDLYEIAKSAKYSARIRTKIKFIDEIMEKRGFRLLGEGTNRLVYNFLEDPTFVCKVAFDKVALSDNPAEYRNQVLLQPFCTKTFEVHPTGSIAFSEKVNPITSLHQFISVADDVFSLLSIILSNNIVVSDLDGEHWMNFGVRQLGGVAFGPVALDYPYVYKLDITKLRCNATIITPSGVETCGGVIDHDNLLANIYCTRCGKKYMAKDLELNIADELIVFTGERGSNMGSRIIDTATGNVLYEVGKSSKTYITKSDDSNKIKINVNRIRTKRKSKANYINDMKLNMTAERRVQEAASDDSGKVRININTDADIDDNDTVTVDNTVDDTNRVKINLNTDDTDSNENETVYNNNDTEDSVELDIPTNDDEDETTTEEVNYNSDILGFDTTDNNNEELNYTSNILGFDTKWKVSDESDNTQYDEEEESNDEIQYTPDSNPMSDEQAVNALNSLNEDTDDYIDYSQYDYNEDDNDDTEDDIDYNDDYESEYNKIDESKLNSKKQKINKKKE